MYCKLFASLYQGTLRGKSHEILVFTNLLATCDKDGFVDKHWRAIAEEVGLTVEEVKEAIHRLEQPDLESRSPENEGKRLLKMDEHRDWGWQIVNYIKYRSIRDAEDRKEQNRKSQENFRNKSKPPSATVSHDKPRSAHAEAEAEVEVKRETSTFRKPTALEVTEYGKSISFDIDGQKFIDYYETAGWMRGKSKVKDWKACVRTWKSTEKSPAKPTVKLRSAAEVDLEQGIES